MTTQTLSHDYDGEVLREQREANKMSLVDVRDWFLLRVPKHKVPSVSKLSRMERNLAAYEDITDTLYGLCALYDLRVSQVSAKAGDELERWSDLLASCSRWITTRCEGQLHLIDDAA